MAPPNPVPVQKTSNDVKISLAPPTCGFVTTYFQLVKSVYVATHPSPQDLEEISAHLRSRQPVLVTLAT